MKPSSAKPTDLYPDFFADDANSDSSIDDDQELAHNSNARRLASGANSTSSPVMAARSVASGPQIFNDSPNTTAGVFKRELSSAPTLVVQQLAVPGSSPAAAAAGASGNIFSTEAVLRAANQGEPDVQFRLGEKYRDGNGVTVDLAQAVYWLNKAAAQGDQEAQSNLSKIYAKGPAVNFELAVYWNLRSGMEEGGRMIACPNSFNDSHLALLPDVLAKFPEFKQVNELRLKTSNFHDSTFAEIHKLVQSHGGLDSIVWKSELAELLTNFDERIQRVAIPILKSKSGVTVLSFVGGGMSDGMRQILLQAITQGKSAIERFYKN